MPLSEPSLSAVDFNGPLVVTPAPTDRFVVRQADGIVRVETREQIHTFEVGEHLILPQVDEPATPTLQIGTSGFYEEAFSILGVSVNGAERWNFEADRFRGTADAVSSPAMRSVASSAANPGFAFAGDLFTGVGWRAADNGVLTAGAVAVADFVEAAGVVQFILPLQNAIATPSLVVDGGSSGLFASAANIVVLASNSQNCMEYSGVGAVPLLGFYGTAAIVKQLGVAVTAAGIHAALVALGFIT